MTAASGKAEGGEELLPCPFCGDKPTYTAYPGGVWHSVQCTDGECPGFAGTRHRFSAAEAFGDWNRRTPAPAANGPGEAVMGTAQQQPTGDDVRAALLFCLWHHQGGSSEIGQPIRFALGIGQYEPLTDEQLAIAKGVQSALSTPQPGMVTVPRYLVERASLILDNASQVGVEVKYINGGETPNAKLCRETHLGLDAALRSGEKGTP